MNIYYLKFDNETGLCTESRIVNYRQQTDPETGETTSEVMPGQQDPVGVPFEDVAQAMRLIQKRSKWINGKEQVYSLEQKTADMLAKQDYKERRRNDYPSIGDQLDMLFHDQVNGTTTWKDSLAAVKAKWPKD